MKYFIIFLLALSVTAEAAKNCSLDGTAGLNPVFDSPVSSFASIPNGYTVCSMGESNTSQNFAEVVLNGRTLINSATGGCTIGNYARDNPSKCWDNMPKSCDIIWIKPINRSLGIDPNVYKAALEQDIVNALTEIENRMTGVKEVHMSGHHATPYSADRLIRGVIKPPKQGEPYSHDSVFPIQNVIAQYQGAYSFKLVMGPYLWANANKPRGDGLQWGCDDFDDDGVHLNDKGNKKAAGILVGSAPPPPDDPPPDDEPQQCDTPSWAERKGYTCEFNTQRQRCICRP